jgi:short-subunit dehydrogenase
LVTSYSYAAYNASKHGVVGLAGALRLEYIDKGVEVSVICPPEINTPMVVEERKTLAPAGAKLKEAAGTLELDPACDYILAKLKRRSYMIVPGFRARCITVIARWFPGIMRKFSERTVIATLRGS